MNVDLSERGAQGLHLGLFVRAEGLEPPQATAHQDLNLARLPFPPRPRGLALVCSAKTFWG